MRFRRGLSHRPARSGDALEYSMMEMAQLILLFGALVVAAILTQAGLRHVGLPALVGYLAVGSLLRGADEAWGLLGEPGMEVLEFLGELGVIVLLFRVGLRSDLTGLFKQLRRASAIWVVNLLASAVLAYLAAHYVLGLETLASLIIATALSATSVGVPSAVWDKRDALDTPAGELFVDVAELDDMSGVMLLAVLFGVAPVMARGGAVASAAAQEAGLVALKLLLLVGFCWAFARWIERPVVHWLNRFESSPDLMLIIAGVGVIIAGAAGAVGLSVAIGAFLAGLAFSRDPQCKKMDGPFYPIYELLSPFFFISVGLFILPQSLPGAIAAGGVLLVAAVAGKFLGTAGPARFCVPTLAATAVGVSMIPRAEIAMLVMQRGRQLEGGGISAHIYSAVVLVSAVTCVGAPLLLRPMVDRIKQRQ